MPSAIVLAPDLGIDLPIDARRALARRVRSARDAVSVATSERFFARHPTFSERFGAAGKERCREDAAFHLDFLAGAIEVGSMTSFVEYARWTERMLAARDIDPSCLVENLTDIGAALTVGMDAPQRAVIDACLHHAEAAIGTDVLLPASPANGRWTGARALFLEAILSGNRRGAAAIAHASLAEAGSPVDVYVEVFQDALYAVGRMWESNEITVAEEHMATAITQFVIADVYGDLPLAEKTRGRFLMTGVSGELHQVGALMVADVLDASGFDVRFLGTNMPHSGVVDAITEYRPTAVGISVTMSFNVAQAARLIDAVHALPLDPAPRIVLGGAAFRTAPHLAAELDVFGWAADARSARALLC